MRWLYGIGDNYFASMQWQIGVATSALLDACGNGFADAAVLLRIACRHQFVDLKHRTRHDCSN